MTDPEAFRAEFPVLARLAYLNAGTNGPLTRRGVEAAIDRWRADLEGGRAGHDYYAAIGAIWAGLLDRLASLLRTGVENVALTRSTTDGVNLVLTGMRWREGDEVLTSTEEHPGVLAPLARLRDRHGVRIRAVPLERVAAEASDETRLVACSHVAWTTGRLAPVEELARLDVPLLYDGAQTLGAVPVDVAALGCDFYAASGQKWLCGPDGTGCLYVRPDRVEELGMPWPNYASLSNPDDPLDSPPAPGALRLNQGSFPGPAAAGWLGAIETFEEAGWDWSWSRASEQAGRLRALLADRFEVLPGDATLVSWRDDDAERRVEELAAEGVVVRFIPGRESIRASVGAWTSGDDLERLVAAL